MWACHFVAVPLTWSCHLCMACCFCSKEENIKCYSGYLVHYNDQMIMQMIIQQLYHHLYNQNNNWSNYVGDDNRLMMLLMISKNFFFLVVPAASNNQPKIKLNQNERDRSIMITKKISNYQIGCKTFFSIIIHCCCENHRIIKNSIEILFQWGKKQTCYFFQNQKKNSQTTMMVGWWIKNFATFSSSSSS